MLSIKYEAKHAQQKIVEQNMPYTCPTHYGYKKKYHKICIAKYSENESRIKCESKDASQKMQQKI